jgi:3-phosphoshikimate 1-carboxyvinyltransferase
VINKIVRPSNKIEGTLYPPADKSISHRAAILNSLAEGQAVIKNFSEGSDCVATIRCLQSMGVITESSSSKSNKAETDQIKIISPGIKHFEEPSDVLNAENSGTTMRFLIGALSVTPFLSVITGDNSLRNRPMGRIVKPLTLMGAHIIGRNNSTKAPLAIKGGALVGIEYEMPVASAQLKSSIMIASLFANSKTTIHQPTKSRDHTERMLSAMGASFSTNDNTLEVTPCPKLVPIDINVPGDISAASFWIVAAIAHPHAKIRLNNVGINPSRSAIIDILKNMGGNISLENNRTEGGEPVADILVESSELTATEVGGNLIPIIQDEIPILALAACIAKGTTIIRNAEELRNKESDRLNTTAVELSNLGAKITEHSDGLSIHGTGYLNGGTANAHYDHRIAMTLGIAGLLSKNQVSVNGAEVVDISYPNFWKDLELIAYQS